MIKAPPVDVKWGNMVQGSAFGLHKFSIDWITVGV